MSKPTERYQAEVAKLNHATDREIDSELGRFRADNLRLVEIIARYETRYQAAMDEIARLREALKIIAGRQQCLDNLMSNVDVACAALDGEKL